MLNHLFTEIIEYKNDFRICYTNKKRMEINFIKMKELYKTSNYRTGLKLDGLTYDDHRLNL
jgi:hypothetical protein